MSDDLRGYRPEIRSGLEYLDRVAAVAWDGFKRDIAKEQNLPHTAKYFALRKQVRMQDFC